MTLSTNAKTYIADILSRIPDDVSMNYIAIGTGTPSGTALGNEIARKRLTNITNDGAVVTYAGYFESDDDVSGLITEVGIFNKATLIEGGTMLCSSTFSAVNKSKFDLFNVNWTLTIL